MCILQCKKKSGILVDTNVWSVIGNTTIHFSALCFVLHTCLGCSHFLHTSSNPYSDIRIHKQYVVWVLFFTQLAEDLFYADCFLPVLIKKKWSFGKHRMNIRKIIYDRDYKYEMQPFSVCCFKCSITMRFYLHCNWWILECVFCMPRMSFL